MAVADLRSPLWRLDRGGNTATLVLSGDWVACDTGLRGGDEIRHILGNARGKSLRFDTSEIGRWDSALVVFLKMLRDGALITQPLPVEVDDTGLPETTRRLLALAISERGKRQHPDKLATSFASLVGGKALEVWRAAGGAATLVGAAALRGGAAIAFRAQMRASDVFQLVLEAGASALGIVAIVNGLVGAILAFVGAVQLERFGAGIYVANLVGIAVVREMAPIVTAIVMAGRTGGAYAAHLATMQGNEEIDALEVFGISVFDLLVLPRILALVLMMPLLYLYGCAIGLFGGLVAAVATTGMSVATFLHQLQGAVSDSQFEIGLAKSIVFGALVALSGCYIGLKTGRSAADVGHAATSAVVAGIVGIIALDAVFAVCANVLGI